jgi:trehalose-phosphatase
VGDLALFLDFDGTLLPIQSRPDHVVLPQQLRKLLAALAHRGFPVWIVSGRSLKDLQRRISIAGIGLAGNHGFEIQWKKKKWMHPVAHTSRPFTQRMLRRIQARLKGIPDILIENKGATGSIHYRNIPTTGAAKVRKVVRQIFYSGQSTGLLLTRGKKVFEIRPVAPWNKGEAILWILKHFLPKRAFPCYIGDDITDEDAFRAVARRGLSIRVGRTQKSVARYQIRSPGEVRTLLQRIYDYERTL